MLTPEEYSKKVEANKANAQQIIQENQELITQFDNLVQKIFTDIEESVTNFDALLKIQDEINNLPKETGLIVSAALGFDVIGNISTTRALVTSAKKLF